nr:MAG TPA: hypothetical protein [Caudoviricetes sp.]
MLNDLLNNDTTTSVEILDVVKLASYCKKNLKEVVESNSNLDKSINKFIEVMFKNITKVNENELDELLDVRTKLERIFTRHGIDEVKCCITFIAHGDKDITITDEIAIKRFGPKHTDKKLAVDIFGILVGIKTKIVLTQLSES